MPSKSELVTAVKALNNAEAWKFFVERREVARENYSDATEAAQVAHDETMAKFRGTAADVPAADAPKPTGQTFYDSDEFHSTKPLSLAQILPWVAANLWVDGLKPSNAPNSDAWGWLMWCRESAANRTEFYKNVYTRLLPTKTQLENAARFHDDGSTDLEFIARVRGAGEAALLSSGPKVLRSKHGFSGADDPGGFGKRRSEAQSLEDVRT